jgi:hypothetical protein
MTEIIHIRCDRCGDDAASEKGFIEGWVHCRVGSLSSVDFCPSCWKTIMELNDQTKTEKRQ